MRGRCAIKQTVGHRRKHVWVSCMPWTFYVRLCACLIAYDDPRRFAHVRCYRRTVNSRIAFCGRGANPVPCERESMPISKAWCEKPVVVAAECGAIRHTPSRLGAQVRLRRIWKGRIKRGVKVKCNVCHSQVEVASIVAGVSAQPAAVRMSVHTYSVIGVQILPGEKEIHDYKHLWP